MDQVVNDSDGNKVDIQSEMVTKTHQATMSITKAKLHSVTCCCSTNSSAPVALSTYITTCVVRLTWTSFC